MGGGSWSVEAMPAGMLEIGRLVEGGGSAVALSFPGWSVECSGCGKAGVDGVKMPSGWAFEAVVATEGLGGAGGLFWCGGEICGTGRSGTSPVWRSNVCGRLAGRRGGGLWVLVFWEAAGRCPWTGTGLAAPSAVRREESIWCLVGRRSLKIEGGTVRLGIDSDCGC
jgi:hypothetical protein